MIQTILFDADGVVIKQKEFFSVMYSRENNLDPEEMNQFFRKEWPEIVIGQADLISTLQQYLPKWKWLKSPEEFLDYWFTSENQLNEELLTTIRKFQSKGKRCFLATNQEKYRSLYMKKAMGFGELFDGMYASCNIGYCKPQLEFYDYIWQDLGQPNKQEIMFWDDQIDNVKTAADFGFTSYQYTDLDQFRQTLSQYHSELLSE